MNGDALFFLGVLGVMAAGSGILVCEHAGAHENRKLGLIGRALIFVGAVHMAPGIFTLWSRAVLG